jgi:fucose permease
MTVTPVLSRRLKLAGILVALGLIIEALTMFWRHPTAFLVFLFLGALLVVAGVLLYLLTIATYAPSPDGA